MTNSLRLALVLSLAACSPSPLGLLMPPDAATEADATPPLPRDVRFAWNASDAALVPDAAQADSGTAATDASPTADIPDAALAPDVDPADAAVAPPDVLDEASAADASLGSDASLSVNGGVIYLADEFPEVQDRIGAKAPRSLGSTTVSIALAVDNVDSSSHQGCTAALSRLDYWAD